MTFAATARTWATSVEGGRIVARAVGWPGRIDDYRNSRPRNVELIGLGGGARDVVAGIARSDFPNLMVTLQPDDKPLAPFSAPVDRSAADMIVMVYCSGDEAVVPTFTGTPRSQVTLILLEPRGAEPRSRDRRVDAMRALSDLFVTTSDREFVRELVSNLAS